MQAKLAMGDTFEGIIHSHDSKQDHVELYIADGSEDPTELLLEDVEDEGEEVQSSGRESRLSLALEQTCDSSPQPVGKENRVSEKRSRRPCGCFASPPQSNFESFVAACSLGIICGWFQFILILFVGLTLHGILAKNVYTFTSACVLLSACWWPLNNRYPWPDFIYGWLFRSWRRYFSWECVVEESLDPKGKYLFAEMPHGIMPMGALLSVSVVRHVFPGIEHISGVAANIVLRIPVIRQLYGWSGIRAAGKKNIQAMYKDGVQVAVVVGGIAEMFLVNRTAECIYLKKRKGFVKLAIQEGADIVPVFFFGNSLLFDRFGGKAVQGFLKSLSRWMKTSIIPFHGRFLTTIPHRQPIKMVSGKPIKITQESDPSQETIDRIHGEFISAVAEIYEKHRPAWETRPLVIM